MSREARKKARKARNIRKELPRAEQEETRDPRTRFTDLSARGTDLSFEGTGVIVPVDYDRDDVPEQLKRNALRQMLGGSGAPARIEA